MPLSRKAIVDSALLVLVNAMWAAQYAGYKVATEQIGPIGVSAWIFLLASLVLLPFLIRERRRNSARPVPQGEVARGGSNERSILASRNLIGFLMVGVLGLVPASALLAWGVDRSTASNAAVICLSVPIMTAVLAVAILGEKMSGLRWISLALSLIGVLILSDFDWRHPGLISSKFLVGNILVLLSAAASSFYNVYSKELLRRFTPLEVLIYSYVTALIVSIPFLSLERFSFAAVPNYTGRTWLGLLTLSVITYSLGMVLWMFLLQRLDVSQASISIYLLALFGVLISAVTLKEKITSTMIVAGIVTLAGTILATSTETSAAQAPGQEPKASVCAKGEHQS